jgi:hypothetical protein
MIWYDTTDGSELTIGGQTIPVSNLTISDTHLDKPPHHCPEYFLIQQFKDDYIASLVITDLKDLTEDMKFAIAWRSGCEIEFDYTIRKFKTKYPVGFAMVAGTIQVIEKKS